MRQTPTELEVCDTRAGSFCKRITHGSFASKTSYFTENCGRGRSHDPPCLQHQQQHWDKTNWIIFLSKLRMCRNKASIKLDLFLYVLKKFKNFCYMEKKLILASCLIWECNLTSFTPPPKTNKEDKITKRKPCWGQYNGHTMIKHVPFCY